jgi:hypothetical protein
MSYFWIYRPTLGNCVSSAGRSSPRLCPGSGSLLHAGAAFLVGTSRWASVSRCAGATTMVHPLESIADTQPQLQPALPSLSAMISQYFTRCRCAVTDCSRPLAAQVCSLQTGRSPSGFALPALSRLLRGRSSQILTLRLSFLVPRSCGAL